jgi:hypothetical protein
MWWWLSNNKRTTLPVYEDLKTQYNPEKLNSLMQAVGGL